MSYDVLSILLSFSLFWKFELDMGIDCDSNFDHFFEHHFELQKIGFIKKLFKVRAKKEFYSIRKIMQ